MPGLGQFYKGSLAAVSGQAYEGWFDLKVQVTDAAGNWQEQVISPAFRIDNLAYSSIANVEPNSNNSDNAIVTTPSITWLASACEATLMLCLVASTSSVAKKW